MPEVLTTRLFPKGRGAAAYRITGVAARCDWVLLSDNAEPRVALVRQREGPPRTVFLSLRSAVAALEHFATEVLPQLTHPFVLVSGSEDVTVPRQIDRRWPAFDHGQRAVIQRILAHPLLLRWHAENLDDDRDPRFAPLPLGRVFADGLVRPDPVPPPTAGRSPRMLCAHRIRDGAQWEPRRIVTALCRGPWRDLCTILDEEVPEDRFVQELRSHTFVLCAEGGGLDPSPKAWQAIAHGAIPIVRRTPLEAAYRQLPVVFVPAWEASSLDARKLQEWATRFAPAHDDPPRRQQVEHRLTLDYWWDRIIVGT